MIHERTPELLEFFDNGQSVATFESENELVQQCRRFSQEPEMRDAIAGRGREVLVARDRHTYGPAANAILRYHEKHCLR
jgi:spore maturation protein CgeB